MATTSNGVAAIEAHQPMSTKPSNLKLSWHGLHRASSNMASITEPSTLEAPPGNSLHVSSTSALIRGSTSCKPTHQSENQSTVGCCRRQVPVLQQGSRVHVCRQDSLPVDLPLRQHHLLWAAADRPRLGCHSPGRARLAGLLRDGLCRPHLGLLRSLLWDVLAAGASRACAGVQSLTWQWPKHGLAAVS